MYSKVVEGGYRLKPQDTMPGELASLMKECLGEDELKLDDPLCCTSSKRAFVIENAVDFPAEPHLRPTFKSIVLYLKACNNQTMEEH